MELTASDGVAASMRRRAGTEEVLTGRTADGQAHPAAMVQVLGADLDDLCLLPRVRLPLVGAVSMRLSSLAPVRVAHVELAASDTRLAALDLPRTQVGGAVEGTAGVGAVLARSDAGAGSVRLSGVRLQSYGLVLDDGLRLGGLRLRAGLGDTAC